VPSPPCFVLAELEYDSLRRDEEFCGECAVMSGKSSYTESVDMLWTRAVECLL
jgi:hypothetical protein